MNMIDYIKEQPVLFKRVLEDRKEITAEFVELMKSHDFTHMYLIASGTSLNAASAAATFIEQVLKVEVKTAASSEKIEYFGNAPLLVYISQGGNSTNTINAIKRDKNYCQLALTANPGCEVNKISRYLEIPCGIETAGPKTKGYTVTILLLYLMALEAALDCGRLNQSSYDGYIKVLEECRSNMENNINETFSFVNKNIEAFKELKCAYIIGKNVSGIVAKEGALKLMETLLIPSLNFEFEEFMHGPACSISDNVSGFYLMDSFDEGDYERMVRLCDYHRGINSGTFTIGKTTADNEKDLIIKKTGRNFTTPFEDILLFQVVSAVIPSLIGLDGVGHSRFWKLDEILKIKASRN